MNFKRISIILSLLSCNLNVLAVPLNKNDLTSNIKDNSDTPENVVSSNNILEDEIYDTLPIDDIDEIINVTDAVIDEEIDSDSDDEVIDTNEVNNIYNIQNIKYYWNIYKINILNVKYKFIYCSVLAKNVLKFQKEF